MKKYGLVFVIILLFGISCNKQNDQQLKLTRYVNPFIGTDGPGNTYPGATVPFGMVQLSPDIGIPGWDRIAGYYYQDSIISGFSHMHLTGTGAGDLYDILVMPTNSKSSKKIIENGNRPYSRFSHTAEGASPGYYSVDLLDFGIKAEVTASKRVGVHRYTFPKDDKSAITIDLGYALNWDSPTDTYIKIIDNQTIEGYRKSTGWAKDQRVFFVMKFSKSFDEYGLFSQDSLITSNEVQGKNTKVILKYHTSENEQIVIKTGLATSNIKGAYTSIEKEVLDLDFDKIKHNASEVWEKELGKIQIETQDREAKSIFYTMMYQSMLAPTLLSDQNGFYKGANDTIRQANDFDRYDTFSYHGNELVYVKNQYKVEKLIF